MVGVQRSAITVNGTVSLPQLRVDAVVSGSDGTSRAVRSGDGRFGWGRRG